MGWYMEPSGIYHVIMWAARRYKKPIYITETGVADMDDQYRQWWIEDTLNAVQRANAQGADVKGYFYWSLLDNFEWSQGFWPKFGLVKVDREHGMKRTIRPSAKWFAERIKKLSAPN
jgi:beta-glucosidase